MLIPLCVIGQITIHRLAHKNDHSGSQYMECIGELIYIISEDNITSVHVV